MRVTLAVCAFLAVIITVCGQDPIVTITETDPDSISAVMEAQQDSDATMSCLVENKQADKAVRWKSTRYDENGVLQFNTISTDTAVEDNIKYSIEKPTAFTWRLRVRSIQVEDEGNYTCFVYTTRDNVKEANRTLLVSIIPYLNPEQTSSDMTVRADTNVNLMCNATGRPAPTIQWTRLGGALLPIGKEMHFDTILSITRVQPEDRGTYRCRAFNTIRFNRVVQQVIRDIMLDVTFPPIVKPVHEEVYQKAGCYRIELQCFVEANPFPSDSTEGRGMLWQKGSRVISESIGRYQVQAIEGAFNRLTFELIINGVEENDFGTYSCQIRNQFGTSSTQVQLIESSAPQPSMKLGRVVSCDACTFQVYLGTMILCLTTLLVHHW